MSQRRPILVIGWMALAVAVLVLFIQLIVQAGLVRQGALEGRSSACDAALRLPDATRGLASDANGFTPLAVQFTVLPTGTRCTFELRSGGTRDLFVDMNTPLTVTGIGILGLGLWGVAYGRGAGSAGTPDTRTRKTR